MFILSVRNLRALSLAISCGFVLAAAAPAKTVDVFARFRATGSKLKATTKVPVLLPSRLPDWVGQRPFAIVEQSNATHYAVDIGAVADCNGAHACSWGHVYGSVKPLSAYNVPGGGTTVLLSTGVPARFVPSKVAAYPTDGFLSWRSGGAYYALSLKGGTLAELLATARSMQRI